MCYYSLKLVREMERGLAALGLPAVSLPRPGDKIGPSMEKLYLAVKAINEKIKGLEV